jgi:hypothetical protein
VNLEPEGPLAQAASRPAANSSESLDFIASPRWTLGDEC